MASRIVIDGNAFYEIDEDCVRRKEEQQRKQQGEREARQREPERTAKEIVRTKRDKNQGRG